MSYGIYCTCFFIALGLVQATSDIPNRRVGTVSGHVFYRDGTPVKEAEVEIHYFGPGSIIPPQTRTDENGYFSLSAPAFGEGFISASKVDEGYPNAAIALYGKEGYTSLRRINVTGIEPLEGINLKFSEPDALIDWTILSSVSHEPIRNARFTISWSDNPKIFSSSPVAEDGDLLFVLPKHPVLVKIAAPGFEDWVYTDERTGSQELLISPGTHQRRTVILHKLN